MQHLIDGIRDAVAKQSWYAALALALVVPDACAAIDDPNARPVARYMAWVDRYLAAHVTQPHFSAEELYRLRCAFLHEGDFALDPPHPRCHRGSARYNKWGDYAPKDGEQA